MLVVSLGGTAPTRTPAHPDPHHEPPRVHLLSLGMAGSSMRSTGSPGPGRPTSMATAWKTSGVPSTEPPRLPRREPEAWRAWGVIPKWGISIGWYCGHISDDLRVRPDIDDEWRKSLTASAHSGRDGRLLWRTRLRLPGTMVERPKSRAIRVIRSPIPFSRRRSRSRRGPRSRSSEGGLLQFDRGPPTLPLEIVSGGSGQRLWSAGSLPVGFDRDGLHRNPWHRSCCEPRGPMDLIVRHQGSMWAARRITWPVYRGATDM